MKTIIDNWQLIFGGIGTAIIAAIVGAWAKSFFDRKASSSQAKAGQSITSGENSRNNQAGRDIVMK